MADPFEQFLKEQRQRNQFSQLGDERGKLQLLSRPRGTTSGRNAFVRSLSKPVQETTAEPQFPDLLQPATVAPEMTGLEKANPYLQLFQTAVNVGGRLYSAGQERRALRRRERETKREIEQGDIFARSQSQREKAGLASRMRTSRQLATSGLTPDQQATQALVEQKFAQTEAEQTGDIEQRRALADAVLRSRKRGELADIDIAKNQLESDLITGIASDIGGAVPGFISSQMQNKQLAEQRALAETSLNQKQAEMLNEQKLAEFEAERGAFEFGQEQQLRREEIQSKEEMNQLRQGIREELAKIREAGATERNTAKLDAMMERLDKLIGSKEKIAKGKEETEKEKMRSREKIEADKLKAAQEKEQKRIQGKAGEKASIAYQREINILNDLLYDKSFTGSKIETDIWDDTDALESTLVDASKRIYKSAPGAYESPEEVFISLARDFGIKVE